MAYQAPRISSQVSVRVDVAMRNKAEGVRKCWEAISRAKGENLDDKGEEVPMEVAHVWRSLLEQRLDHEVAEFTGGLGFPRLDDKQAWDALLKTVAANALKKNAR